MDKYVEISGFSEKVFQQISDGIYIVDKNRKISYWNKAAEEISGYTVDEMIGTYCYNDKLSHIDETGQRLCQNHCPLAHTLKDGKHRQALVYLHHKQGQRIPVKVNIDPIYDENNQIIAAVEVFKDESYQTQTQHRIEALEKKVFFDTLTKIPNRAFLQQALETTFARLNRYGMGFGIILYDIDYFKKVNDEYGHNAGDKVLQSVATTLYKNTRTSDHIGRWGGEEFLSILPNVTPDELISIAERFRTLIAHSETNIGDQKINVTVSAGCAIAQYNEDLNELINRADMNLYLSKQRGRNQVTIGADLQTVNSEGRTKDVKS